MQLTALKAIPQDQPVPIKDLNVDQLTELQTALVWLGYPSGDIDGKYGPKTRNAWAEFIADVHQGDPGAIDVGCVSKLQQLLNEDKPAQAHDFSTRGGTIAAIQSECSRQGIGLNKPDRLRSRDRRS